ncbi:acyl-CoA thioesterase II [Hansschlegelia quercus]|uniref:Acyl-CoA thioesterase 2 n=1 Tax=Hansschlegelia quercus TaxID=2528245 RepID=A0A4Q9GDM9_9HYPH|nr:acyl-CoA thioesterase II [Hansschlegelia quercus]TBN48284.1 acyl-CoA thioesterase II [Hansschlegelia quercus]
MSAVAELLKILDLEQLDVNLFRGRSPQTGWQRVFGGQVVGQALVAATRTVEGRSPHSLHGYFMLPGDPSTPIIYEVECIRDGRSFVTRRVVATQHGQAIFSMSASFQTEEEGFSHQIDMPDIPRPTELPSEEAFKNRLPADMPQAIRNYLERERPIELRPVDLSRYVDSRPRPPMQSVWIRATERLPDDPAAHQSVLAYASDMTLLDTALVAHGSSVFSADIQGASLDHALWLHRPFRADDWLLYTQDSPFAGGGRGFSRGRIYTEAGELVASVAQEGLIRRRRK